MKPDHITEDKQFEMQRELAHTSFVGTKTTNGKFQRCTWAALATALADPTTYPTKAACALMRFGTFAGNSRASGSKLLSLDVLQVDYDDGLVSVAEASERLRCAGVRSLVYTTPSHQPERPRWRIVAPLAASITEDQHEALVDLLNGAVGGILAVESWHWTRCYYVGRVEGAAYETAEVEGECIDIVAACPDFDPIACPTPPPKAPRQRDLTRTSDQDDDIGRYIVANGHALGRNARGLHTCCPRKEQHGEQDVVSSTTWLFATASEVAHIECLHKSHELPGNGGKITNAEFLPFIGYDDVIDDFSGCTLTEAEAAESTTAAIRNAQKREQRGPVVVVDSATGEILEVVSPAFSDDQLALQFAGRAAAFLRWTPGLGWMAYDGQVWRRDEHLQRFGLARTICRDAARQSDKAAEAKALASSRAVSAVVSLAQFDTRLMVPVAEWDSDPVLLNTPDGVVDLRTGELAPRGGHLVTRCARVSPAEGAGCATWLAFLQAAFKGDQEVIDFVQRLLGYTLTGDRREQKLFFLWGEGSNGKSTLADLVLWLLGSYALKLSSAVLMQTAHDKHPTELAQLQGIRLAMSSELEEGAFFNEARVKELTGDAVLSARFMRGDFFEFAMQHKHIIVGNHRPRLRGGDPAMARRLVLVPFRAVFPEATQDKALPEKLKAEGAAILAWLIEGAVNWRRHGIGTPAAVLTASADYLANHDDVQQWLDERCRLSADGTTRAGVLYSDFAVWKVARGEKPPSLTVWGERMALKPGLEKRRSGGTTYAGVSLLPSAPISTEEFA